jgi:hypothetical protein
MRALSIRQPYAEMILRGEKTIEYRSRPTKIIGERFYIYAARKYGQRPETCGLRRDICSPAPAPQDSSLRPQACTALPTGVIVGTAVISHVTNGGPPGPTAYEWHLTDVRRVGRPRQPKRQPQPVWFRPF